MSHALSQRLLQEQQAALSSTQQQLQQWTKFKDDYVNLQKKLKDLPKEVSYDYMVPFGPLAFMPGKLIHTNEIMVLLGDNWFAEMSAQQSCEVIDRRLTNVERTIKNLTEQQKLLETRANFTQQEFSGGEMDIREAYDSDEDKKWRASHKESVRREKLRNKQAACTTDEKVFDRLNLLQLKETRDREMSLLGDASEDKLTQQTPQKAEQEDAKKIDLSSLHQTDASSSMDSDDSSDNEHVIHFKHSPRSADDRSCDPENDTIQSPADIYRLYGKASPRSILKQERSFESVKSSPSADMQPNVAFAGAVQKTALQTHVMEKPPAAGSVSAPDARVKDSVPQQPPRVSKFKAMRQNRKNT